MQSPSPYNMIFSKDSPFSISRISIYLFLKLMVRHRETNRYESYISGQYWLLSFPFSFSVFFPSLLFYLFSFSSFWVVLVFGIYFWGFYFFPNKKKVRKMMMTMREKRGFLLMWCRCGIWSVFLFFSFMFIFALPRSTHLFGLPES